MKSNNLRVLSLVLGLSSIAAVGLVFLFIRLNTATVDAQIKENPATQARPLTPAGKLLTDAATGEAAVFPLTENFVRTPDKAGADGKGRYLIAVNGGFGLQFDSRSKAQQTISVIDLNAAPEPRVIQNLYFPSPQSANYGAAFNQTAEPDGSFRLYVAGGFENKIWIFSFKPNAAQPLAPANAPDKIIEAPFIDVAGLTENAPSPDYNSNAAPVYPMGIALSADGETLYSANNLGDTLGIIADLRETRRLTRIALQRPNSTQFVYPYDVKLLKEANGTAAKIYVSLWGDGSIAVIDAKTAKLKTHIQVERHPTLMLLNRDQTRLFVVNSDGDSVSIINTKTDALSQAEPKIDIKLDDISPNGFSPQGLALSENEKTLYVANAKTNSVAVVALNPNLKSDKRAADKERSQISGFIPTGNYASAVAVVGKQLFIASGKGTGVENSSTVVSGTGKSPNLPNEKFPGGGYSKRGAYNPALVVGNINVVDEPTEKQLYEYTQATMRNNGLLGDKRAGIFPGGQSPFKHAVYIIRENRTYDQVFGDLQTSGDGSKADGAAQVAIFGAGEAAKSPSGQTQNITPNARALALRFGLFDRFFVNAEASPDGHNWSTAAFSNDYIDKAFRWNYSGRGRTYDYEGFNRLPSYDPPANQPPVSLPSVFKLPATETDVAGFLKKYIPYLKGNRDVGEPESLYLWDAARRANLTYRNYGEYVATVSAEDVKEVNSRQPKKYPDISPTLTAFATKKSLENHFSITLRNFDQNTPDSMTTDSYLAAKQASEITEPAITTTHREERFRGSSRFGDWLAEFRGNVANLQAGKGDNFPNLSIIRFSNDHTAGLRQGIPTPQFYVAENDYAVGRLVEEVSHSPYWRDTAIFVVEDDAQDGPDHVDAHRSPAFVISAYNRKGALIHDFHNTVSLIRTIELCLGIAPMNFLDANAVPMNVFTNTFDAAPFTAQLPEVAADNLFPPAKTTAAMQRFYNLTAAQDLKHPDMANPFELNQIIWFSVKGEAEPMPAVARLPAFDLMTAGINPEDEDEDEDEDENAKGEIEDKRENMRVAEKLNFK